MASRRADPGMSSLAGQTVAVKARCGNGSGEGPRIFPFSFAAFMPLHLAPADHGQYYIVSGPGRISEDRVTRWCHLVVRFPRWQSPDAHHWTLSGWTRIGKDPTRRRRRIQSGPFAASLPLSWSVRFSTRKFVSHTSATMLVVFSKRGMSGRGRFSGYWCRSPELTARGFAGA